jgi:hypothetical protein
MKRISYLAKLTCLIAFLYSTQMQAQYTINDVFGDPNECSSMARDIFIVWWDKDFDYSAEVDVMLDQMIEYRNTCLNVLNMMDPPNPIDGYYYNVYLHGDGGYFDVYGWGNGQGTDSNGYPFLTLPYWITPDLVNLAHETFHIFQYNANSPGFAYSGDSQWYIEASANWFAGVENIDAPRAFIEAESLVRLPHVPLWLSYDNFPNTYPQNWQRYVHQYAMALFLFYLTDQEGVSPNLLTEGFFAGTSELPQEYLFNQIGSTGFRNHFMDWAAHMTNNFDFITPEQAEANEMEWNNYADPNDDNEFTETFSESGTNGWYQAENSLITNAWSFNTYQLENNSDNTYTFEINGDPNGSYGDPAYFQGKVMVINSNNETSFYDVPMTNDWQGSLTLELTASDTDVYFIVGSMPEIFRDENAAFQLFPYQIRITNGLLSTSEFNITHLERVEVARYNLLGQKIDKSAKGIQIILYDDGSVKKVFELHSN